MTKDEDYTDLDHRFRSADQYALAKYRITLRWIERSGLHSGRLVNIGCGAGLFNHMAVDAGFDVLGVEPDPVAFALAEADRPAERCELRNCGVEDLGDIRNADIVVMHDVLEHIEDHRAAVASIASMLAPRGIAIISVPALQSLWGLHDEQLGHVRRYRRHTLREVLSPPLKVERMRYFGFAFIPVTFLLSRVLRRPYPVEAASEGLLSTAMRGWCEIESRLPVPVGTSLLALCQNARTS